MKGEERREQILQAAVKVFATHGYEKTSIAKICKPIKIGRGTLYEYFGNKQALFRAIIEKHSRLIEELVEPLSMGQPATSSPAEFLLERTKAVFEELMRNRDLWSVIIREAQARNPDTSELVRSMWKSFHEIVFREIEVGVANGHYNVKDPEFAASFLIGAGLGILEDYIFDQEHPPPVDELAWRTTELTLRVFGYSS